MILLAEHPIEGLMTTAMQSIKDMVDVNTIVGDAVQSPDGTVIIPISRVSFGFAAGGGEYAPQTDNTDDSQQQTESKFPFAGGSGAGVTINPVAFMVVGQNQIRLLPVNINSSLDKVIDYVPEFLDNLQDAVKSRMSTKKQKNNNSKDAKSVDVSEDE